MRFKFVWSSHCSSFLVRDHSESTQSIKIRVIQSEPLNTASCYFRMECVYRLLYSCLAVQWKSYLMATESFIFPFLLNSDQECFCMTSFLAVTSLGSRVYFSGGSVLRYWYVKSSLKPEVTAGVQSRKTLYTCLGIPQILILLHLFDALIVYNTKEGLPILLYQACLDPTSDFTVSFFTAMPFQVIMSYIYVSIGIYNNLYLYWFLRLG